MEHHKGEGFRYSSSAQEREEVKAIRKKYEKADETCEDTMTRLRRLDARVTRKGTAVSLVLGVLGALLLGSGMSLFMTTLGEELGMTVIAAMTVGIVIGLLGIVLVALAYPVYAIVTRRERDKIAPEILRLTDELMK